MSINYLTPEEFADDILTEDESEVYEEVPKTIDDSLAEAEERIRTAQYYKILLDNGFFEDRSPTAQKVEEEVREFVQQRYLVLVGLKQEVIHQPPPPPLFTNDEVRVLKAIITVAQKKPVIVQNTPPPQAEPQKPAKKTALKTVRKQQTDEVNVPEAPAPVQKAPQQPVRPPVIKPPAKVGRPTVKKSAVPDEIKDTRSVPQSPPPTPDPKVVKAPKTPKGPKQDPRTAKALKKLKNGEELLGFEENGTPRIRKNGRIYIQAVDAEGNLHYNEKNEPIWKDVTPVAVDRDTPPLPMPTGMHMTTVLAAQAEDQIHRGTTRNLYQGQ